MNVDYDKPTHLYDPSAVKVIVKVEWPREVFQLDMESRISNLYEPTELLGDCTFRRFVEEERVSALLDPYLHAVGNT